MKNNIIVVFSSHLSDEENNTFINHINKTIGAKHKVVSYQNFNQYSLSEIYNRAIDEHYEENSIFVMCHNDILIKTNNWGKILLSLFNNNIDYSIIGVAGTTYLPKSGKWWEDRTKMVGIVEHSNGYEGWVNYYSKQSNDLIDVLSIDGLFMAIDTDSIIHKFDESYGKFHFYDISMVFPNYLSGLNIGVTTNIRVLHKSIGITNEEWEKNRIKFTEEYEHDLPMKHISEDKLKVLICCQFFKNYTGSEMSNFELAKELVKQGLDVTIISIVVGEPLYSMAKKYKIKVIDIRNSPNYVLNNKNQFEFIRNDIDFDIIHINHKPIGEIILQLYPNTPAVMHIRSEVIPVFEAPIVHENIKKYISIRDSITDYIKSFGIAEKDIIHIDNPFDYSRFNTNYDKSIYSNKQDKKVILFIGTLDHLRKNILFDLKEMVIKDNEELWIIGADNGNYLGDLIKDTTNIVYLGIQSNVETYIKKCDYTAGIFKGRTTIEGFLCGKPGYVYTVDKNGNILNKEFQEVPNDVSEYRSDISTEKVINLYHNILGLNEAK